MTSTRLAPEISNDIGYLETVAKQLQSHGLPHDADQILCRAEAVRHEPRAIAKLREEVSGKFLHYFEI
jgi:hypothetical protein